MRKPITLTLTYKGGNECWIMVKGRGETNLYPGGTWLVDLLRDVNQDR